MIETPFQHGVASGDADATSAVIWTRITGITAQETVEWSVRETVSRDVIRQGSALSLPDNDFAVKALVKELPENGRFEYWFSFAGHQSPIGKFKTLGEAATVLRFAVACCAKFNAGFFNAYRHMVREDLDFVLFLGDYVYEAADYPPGTQTATANIGRPFDPTHECFTLTDYRTRYAQYRRDPDVQALHAAHAMWPTIDDHELADNAWSNGADEHREAEHGPWQSRKAQALRAWVEWMPVRRGATEATPPIHTSWQVGSLARFVLLDARTWRSDPLNPEGIRTELGTEQLEWLLQLIQSCDCRWLVLGSPSMLTPIWSPDLDPDARSALQTLKLISHDGDGPFHDLWDAYPEERAQIRAALVSGPASPLVLSGDIHIAVESELGDPARPVPEWVVPSVTSQNLDDKRGWTRRTSSLRFEEHLLRCRPEWRFCNCDDHGYLVVELRGDTASGEWKFVEAVRTYSDAIETGHSTSASSSGRPNNGTTEWESIGICPTPPATS